MHVFLLIYMFIIVYYIADLLLQEDVCDVYHLYCSRKIYVNFQDDVMFHCVSTCFNLVPELIIV